MHEQGEIRDEGEEHQLLKGYLLYWFESMVLLGKLSDCIKLVGELRHKTHVSPPSNATYLIILADMMAAME